MTYKILISDPLNDDGLKCLIDAPDVEVVKETGLSAEELRNKISEFDALLVRSQTQVTRDIIENAKKLKVIGRAGVGVDNIDITAATEHGIIVVNAPDGNTISTAEHTMAMLMAMARKIPQAYCSLRENKWERKSFVGVELNKKTLGIIGFGRIGREVAKRAKGHCMNVVAYDPFLTKEQAEKLGVTFGTLEDVLEQGDFITIHTPLLKETRHLISRKEFEIMKNGVHILNCARGGIIDEEALYEAIINKKVVGAAIDVFEHEPTINHKLLELPGVIATPHLGASTVEAQENVAIDVSYDVLQILRGNPALHPVNLPSFSQEVLNKVQPYFTLAETLGAFIAQIAKGAIQEISFVYSGQLTELDVSMLNRLVVKGILQKYLGDHVNYVNAIHLAKQRDIVINEQKTTGNVQFTNLITVEVKTTEETRSVSGTLLVGLGGKIARIDGYCVDVTPNSHMILINHHDQPGVIGRVGNILGKFEVNIATMQVGRICPGGDAIMVLTVDKEVEEDCLKALQELTDIVRITSIEL